FGDGGVLFLSLNDQLVVHVGDVDDERDLVAAIRQVALDGVEDDRANHVAEVAGLVDGRTADVHTDLTGHDRLEGFLLPGQRVIDAQSHRTPLKPDPSHAQSAPPPGSRWPPPGRSRPPARRSWP